MPCRTVSKTNFLCTPCRLMFDTSQSTTSGSRFNDVLIKERNNMNTLVEVVIADLPYKNTFHIYVRSMYYSAKGKRLVPSKIYMANWTGSDKSPWVKIKETLMYSSNQVGIKLRWVWVKCNNCQNKTNNE